MKKSVPVVIIVLVLLATLGGGIWMMQPSQSPAQNSAPAQAKQETRAPAATATPPPAAPAGPPRHVRGPADAPVLLEEYSDFQCPQCARMHTIIKELQRKYPSQLRVGFRHFPLRQIHRHARESALAAEAAAAQGKFWEMHDLLYERQSEWSAAAPARPLFVRYAQSLGLDAARFEQDLDSSVMGMRVDSDERLARSMQLGGTPSFFVNGRELAFEESNDLPKLSAQVERALAERKK